jgi:glycosyltransferase involved in cell wall biosynthesis
MSLRVGFLHLGRAESGVRRYGRLLAAAAAQRDDLEVIEADAGDRTSTLADLRRAARKLRAADVIHLQWKLADWGGPYAALPRLELFLDTSRRPTVATLHDVYEPVNWRERWTEPAALGIRRLSLTATSLVVHAEEERRRLGGLAAARKLAVVPHFVEERVLPQREAARSELGLGGRCIITLLGFMTRRKGHLLVLESLRLLPDDVFAIFAGAPIEGRGERADELQAAARELGVADRVRFTGYVPEAELTRILAATDIAACPFRDMAASGSLATWISTGRPIVASDLPALREYVAMEPGSLHLFAPLTAEAFAATVGGLLEQPLPEVDAAVDRLRRQLATPHTVARYADLYRAALAH